MSSAIFFAPNLDRLPVCANLRVERYRPDDPGSEATMPTAEECREAFEKLTGRLAQLDPKDRDAFFAGRSFSCRVTDLDVTFVTRFGPGGAPEPVREADPGDPPADVRMAAASPVVLELAEDIHAFPRAWLSGRVKVQASIRDILRLRKLL
jgi:hypothetical protein